MNKLVRVAILTLALACSSCVVGTHVDVSSEARFAQYLGGVYDSKIDLDAIGITMDQNYRTGIDIIRLVAPPGFTGPEVKGRAVVKAGARLTVVAVSTLHFVGIPSGRYFFVVEGASCEICAQAKVIVKVSEAADNQLAMPNHFSLEKIDGS